MLQFSLKELLSEKEQEDVKLSGINLEKKVMDLTVNQLSNIALIMHVIKQDSYLSIDGLRELAMRAIKAGSEQDK